MSTFHSSAGTHCARRSFSVGWGAGVSPSLRHLLAPWWPTGTESARARSLVHPGQEPCDRASPGSSRDSPGRPDGCPRALPGRAVGAGDLTSWDTSRGLESPCPRCRCGASNVTDTDARNRCWRRTPGAHLRAGQVRAAASGGNEDLRLWRDWSCLPIVTIVCMADPATAQGSEMEQLWDEQGWFSASSRLRRVP